MTKAVQKLALIMQEYARTEKLILELAEELLNENRWLSLNEAMEESGLTAAQIRYAAKCGRLRSRKESERKIFYYSEDLARLSGFEGRST